MDADTGDTGTGVATVPIIYTVDIYIDDEHYLLRTTPSFLLFIITYSVLRRLCRYLYSRYFKYLDNYTANNYFFVTADS